MKLIFLYHYVSFVSIYSDNKSNQSSDIFI